MSIWQQHYYTWSTKSLSQNKVGLGIVAVSSEDRDALLIADHFGAKSEVIREEKELTIERGSYTQELPGYIRTGATPCEQGADQRNNKFVHVYSMKTEELTYPENYLGQLNYNRKWNGESKLLPLSCKTKEEGREIAIQILKKYKLEYRLEELFASVYRCLLSGVRPLSITDVSRDKTGFQDFSREMMILIHYMIPQVLRKEADYVSYICEDSQEARFLFGKTGGKYTFDVHNPGKLKNYVLLEKDFYKKLADTFLLGDDKFEKWMTDLDKIIRGLSDRRNQLEKCVFASMASDAGKEKKKDDFFTSMERLMYWARKDESLIPAIKEATKELDFHGMNKEELLAYTKLLLIGAGGETKKMVYDELNRMLGHYYKQKDKRFRLLINYICDNNSSAYEDILVKNKKGFAKEILWEPIDNKNELLKAVKKHTSFFTDEKYKKYVVQSSYTLYQQSKEADAREEISNLGKEADEVMFVELKQKDVEKVLDVAANLTDYMDIMEQLDIETLEKPIQEEMAKRYISLLKKEKDVYQLNVDQWICFVLRLSRIFEVIDKKRANEIIRETKDAILKENDKELLDKANRVLGEHSSYKISYPKSMVEEKIEPKTSNKEMDTDMEERGWKNLLLHAGEDLMTKTIWAVLLGIYGFLFVTVREVTVSPTEYWLSIGVLIGMILCYGIMTLMKERKDMTPGGIVYVLGVGIFWMNWALALDTTLGVIVLTVISLIGSIAMKIFYNNYFIEEE